MRSAQRTAGRAAPPGAADARSAPDMQKHVDLLGVLYVLCGAVGLLVGVALLALALGAASLTADAAGREVLAASITALAFAALAALSLAWGVANVLAGSALRRHRPWGRLVALVMGVLNLFLLPIGTVLGAYSLWVLLNERTRPLFEPSSA